MSEPEAIGTNQNPSDLQKTHFQGEDDQALAQAAQGDCGVSIPRDIQKPSERGAGQLALGGPDGAGDWTR